jgi:hypothetical protein
MAHTIEVFIMKRSEADLIKNRPQYVHIVSLKQDFVLIPLTKDLTNEISHNTETKNVYEQFRNLTKPLEEFARTLSLNGMVAYIETEYFGGEGEQSAILWENKSVILEPLKDTKIGPINLVLKHMGVQVYRAFDEFEALGLVDYRSNSELVKSTLIGGKQNG